MTIIVMGVMCISCAMLGLYVGLRIFRATNPANQVEGVAVNQNANADQIKLALQKAFKKSSQRFKQESAARVQEHLLQAVEDFDVNIRVHLSGALLDYTKTPLPQGTRFIIPFDRAVYYVVEQPPGPRTIRHSKGHNGKIHFRTVSFPYMVFIAGFTELNIGRLHVACRNEPLTSIDDRLWRIHLSNIYKGAFGLGVCEPSGYKNYGNTPGEQVDCAISRFWQTRFTGLGMESAVKDKRLATVAKWETATKQDKFFATQIEWHNSKATPNSIIRQLAYEGKQRHNSDYRKEAQLLSREVSKILNREVDLVLPDEVEIA